MWMPIILLCSSVYAESCNVITRNWEFHKTLEKCLQISTNKGQLLLQLPNIYHVKPMCQEIILGQEI